MAGGSHGSEASAGALVADLGIAIPAPVGYPVTGWSSVPAESLPGRGRRRPGPAAGPGPRGGGGTSAGLLRERSLKSARASVDRGIVTTPLRPVPRPPVPVALRAAVAWARSPASLPWRGDLVRAALAPVVVGAAAVAPARALPLTAVVLVAGAYLLLVLAAALGRLDSGVRVPAGLLLGLDALHLFWAAHLTSGLGGPVPVVAATAATCLLLRLALLPPLTAPRTSRTATGSRAAGSAAGAAARRCPGCPHSRAHHPERERLELARAHA